MADLKKIVEEAGVDMSRQTELLAFDIDRGADLSEGDFREAYGKINDIMTAAYRKVAPNGQTAENAGFMKELTTIHNKAKESISDNLNEYRKIAAFAKKRGAIQIALVAPLEELHSIESKGGVVDADSIVRISSNVKKLDGYVEEVGMIEVPGTYWGAEKDNFITGLLEDRMVFSSLLNKTVASLSEEVGNRVQDASFDTIDEVVQSDNTNYWTGGQEIPADIVATRLAQIRYAVDLVDSMVKIRATLGSVPEAQNLVNDIDQAILDAGEYLAKAREHYTKFIVAEPQRKLQIEQALRTYSNLCANFAAAKKTGNAQRIAGAENALKQHMATLSSVSDRIYDYDQEVPESSVPITINRFAGLNPESVDISDVRNEYNKIHEAKVEEAALIASLEDGQTVKIDGKKITKKGNQFVVEGERNTALTPEDALMVASLPPVSSETEMEGPARSGETRLASNESTPESTDKKKKT